ncbi:MAG: HD domain-containing protein [Candidatus Hydrogenedentes bacterium]|nr:HD domain-containing protein [Candidatus Hydrogenedentota bacterium]
MRLESVDKLKPGDVVARPICDDKGQVLLHDGVELKAGYISMLKQKGFNRIYVREADCPVEVEPDEELSPATRSRALAALREGFGALEGELRNVVKRDSLRDLEDACGSSAMQALLKPTGPIGKISELVAQILEEVLTQPTLAGLRSIKSADSQLYDHSLDVCVAAIMIGHAVGMTNIRLGQLATGCLLHDIGMIFVPEGVSETGRIRQHTLLGFELLRNSPDPDILAPHVALEHHEHQDGTGQPRGLRGSNTIARVRVQGQPVPTLIGEIAAVANAYDALSAGDGGRGVITPDRIIAAISAGAGTLFNREVVNAFLRVVPVYGKGMDVQVRSEPYMNHGAVVSRVNPARLDRPEIIIYRNEKGKPITPVTVDLADEMAIEIRHLPAPSKPVPE